MMFYNLNSIDLVFFAAVSIATYTYIAFSLRKTPDSLAEFGISLNAMMTGLLTVGVFLVAFLSRLLLGYGGYILTAVFVPPLIHKIVMKMKAENRNTTA